MLYTFDKFWKSVSLLVGVWIMYGICGYEFTVITLLASIFLRLKK